MSNLIFEEQNSLVCSLMSVFYQAAVELMKLHPQCTFITLLVVSSFELRTVLMEEIEPCTRLFAPGMAWNSQGGYLCLAWNSQCSYLQLGVYSLA